MTGFLWRGRLIKNPLGPDIVHRCYCGRLLAENAPLISIPHTRAYRSPTSSSLSSSISTTQPLWLRQILFPSECGPAIQQQRCGALGSGERFERGSLSSTFEPARLVVKTLQRLHLLVACKLCVPDRRLHDTDRLVVDLDRDGIGVPVLAAV